MISVDRSLPPDRRDNRTRTRKHSAFDRYPITDIAFIPFTKCFGKVVRRFCVKISSNEQDALPVSYADRHEYRFIFLQTWLKKWKLDGNFFRLLNARYRAEASRVFMNTTKEIEAVNKDSFHPLNGG